MQRKNLKGMRDEQGDLIGNYEKHECPNRETEPFYNFD